MSRTHARKQITIWNDADWRALPMDAQWLYDLVCSQANITQAGVIAMTPRRWAALADGVEPHTIEQAAKTLAAHDFFVMDEATEEILVRTFIRNDGVLKQPNVLKNALHAARAVQSPVLRLALATELRRIGPLTLRAVPRGHQPLAITLMETLLALDPDGATVSPSEGQGEPFAEPFTEGFAATPSEGQGEGYIGEGVGEGGSSSVGNPSSRPDSQASRDQQTQAKPRTGKAPEPDRDDVRQLCDRLKQRIVANGGRATITDEWRRAARLLLDNDKRELDKALRLVDWCQADQFWQANVLSMPTFRKHYDRLRLKAMGEWESGRQRTPTGPVDALTDDQINPDEILGPDHWSAANHAPPEVHEMPREQRQKWFRAARAQHDAERVIAARTELARRQAARGSA